MLVSFCTVLLLVHVGVCSGPSVEILEALGGSCSATSQRFSLKMTTRCHSVRSRRALELRSRQVSEVASDRLAILVPSWVLRISGSRPRLPTRMTLFTLPAMLSFSNFYV